MSVIKAGKVKTQNNFKFIAWILFCKYINNA